MTALPAFADALLRPQAPIPAQLRSWNGSDPARRFDVHRNNVMSSLLRALQDAFPVTCRLVGDDFFRAMASEYVRAEPPSSPVLLDHGANFAAFVETFEPAAPVVYLADMARLERARLEAFHAMDAVAMAPDQFRPWLEAPEQLMRCRLQLHPSRRLLPSLRPVLALWQAHAPGVDHGLEAALDLASGPRREDVLVLRPAFDVQALALGPGLAATLAALADGAMLGEALDVGAAHEGFELDAALAVLVHGGATVALQP